MLQFHFKYHAGMSIASLQTQSLLSVLIGVQSGFTQAKCDP